MEEFVDQRGFTVVNVGDDGNISERARHEALSGRIDEWLRREAGVHQGEKKQTYSTA